MSHFYLSGPSGAGKTTAGALLAREIGLPFVDLDAFLEESTGHTIAAMFAQLGERSFRVIESFGATCVSKRSPCVVALGGGTVLDPANRNTLRATGLLVTLYASTETLVERVGDCSTRPLLAGDPRARLEAMMLERVDAYADADRVLCTTGLSPADVVARLRAIIAPGGSRCVSPFSSSSCSAPS